MQTFLTSTGTPLEIMTASAASLDNQRLGKQRVEAKQIYTALSTGQGWVHHPATKMWAGHLEALAQYGFFICHEWYERGFEDTLGPWFFERGSSRGMQPDDWPWWFGNSNMIASHRSKLIHKQPAFYQDKWPQDGGYRLPYLWPTGANDLKPRGFYLSAAEFKRKDWSIPGNWFVDTTTRQVYFDE